MDNSYPRGMYEAIYTGMGTMIGFTALLELIQLPNRSFQGLVLLLLGFQVLTFWVLYGFKYNYLVESATDSSEAWADFFNYGGMGPIFSCILYLCVCRYNSFAKSYLKFPFPLVYLINIVVSIVMFLFGLYWFYKHPCNVDSTLSFCPATLGMYATVKLVFGVTHSLSSVIIFIFDLSFLGMLLSRIARVREGYSSMFNWPTIHQLFYALTATSVSVLDTYYAFSFVAGISGIFYELAFITYSIQFLSLAKMGINVKNILNQTTSVKPNITKEGLVKRKKSAPITNGN